MYRLKTQPYEEHDKMTVGHNGLLAAVKAQWVADETGLVCVLERQLLLDPVETASGPRRDLVWMPDETFFPKVAS